MASASTLATESIISCDSAIFLVLCRISVCVLKDTPGKSLVPQLDLVSCLLKPGVLSDSTRLTVSIEGWRFPPIRGSFFLCEHFVFPTPLLLLCLRKPYISPLLQDHHYQTSDRHMLFLWFSGVVRTHNLLLLDHK